MSYTEYDFLEAGKAFSVLPQRIYPESINHVADGQICMADFGDFDAILFHGDHCPFIPDETVEVDGAALCRIPLSHESARCLHKLLPFTAPTRVLKNDRTFGLGDRIGISAAGHIRAIQQYDVYPVLAQQSIRELKLMDRSYEDIIDIATFGVFRTGYRKGYGADGDHVKTIEEAVYAIDQGCTMITLDCSKYIHEEVTDWSDEKLIGTCTLSEEQIHTYLRNAFELGDGIRISFTETELRKAVLIYGDAVRFTIDVYDTLLRSKNVDFELSIDETDTPTTPAQHFYVANELNRSGISVQTIAPRFCGDYQKGIDYIGDPEQLEKELKTHVAVAEHFGHKISFHSASEKFKVYPLMGKETKGRFHIKTSGTNWLQAMLLVSELDPSFFRELYTFAVSIYEEPRKQYHIVTEIWQVPDIDTIDDEDLPALFSNDHARQLIYVSFGPILSKKLPYREKLYKLWRDHRDELTLKIERNIDHHLRLLLG